eukprot:CAMPEP_0204570160 /NCGR_PEP_ID=MMETSP0661-20131031/38158_1 /ASSEMBLY_ACC=CAM_ASM_000606 /TAXON_ID=109239 /ORGANISM="Alexandrium margalefi, Strain AMGDE01CS-322" /LENGTH=221 /DNA_ID=CAMNT_0051578329 /DNA_START=46 /DNA_END=711 /DNA_ORIENTATION=-
MAIASQAQLEALERRLAKAEQTIMRQDTQIKVLQARLDGAAGPDPFAAYRDRSRSPRPIAALAAPKIMQPPAHGPVMSLEEFIMNNGLDEKSSEALRSQTLEVQNHIVSQGPVEGRNPSAMVMGRIAKASSEFMAMGAGAGPVGATASWHGQTASYTDHGELQQSLEEFIMTNGIDEKCAEALRGQPAECQAAVISLGAADGRNPSAMVMGRIAKYQRGEL